MNFFFATCATSDVSEVDSRSPRRKLTLILFGLAAIAMYGMALWIGSETFSTPRYAGALQTYAALALISIATTAVCELLFQLVDFSPKLLRPPHLALMTGAGLLMAIVYGPKMFITYYSGDDWFYTVFQFAKLDWTYLNEPISNHYLPLLSLILHFVSKYSDPGYFGYSAIFYLACMLVVTGLTRLVAAHTPRYGLVALVALSFAMWPSFEGARTYFAGGFWLALPVASLFAMLLVMRRLLLQIGSAWSNLVSLAVLAFVTVLTSSQILIPIIYLAIYVLPYWMAADAEQRQRFLRLGVPVTILTTLPTAIAALGRQRINALKPISDFSGLWDGSFLTNLAMFVKAKVGFEKISTTILVCIVLYAGFRYVRERILSREPGHWPELPAFLFVLTLCGLTMPKGAFTPLTTPLWMGGLALFGGRALWRRYQDASVETSADKTAASALSLCGLGILLFFLLQVGLGRRWGISTALADYYAMFPLAGCWLLAAGAITSQRKPGLSLWRTGMVTVAMTAICIYSIIKYLPTADYIEQVSAQRAFVRELGVAACEEASAVRPGQRLHLRERYSAGLCKFCNDVLWIPEGVLGGSIFSAMTMTSARNVCPALANRLAFDKTDATQESTGSGKLFDAFYKRHYAAP